MGTLLISKQAGYAFLAAGLIIVFALPHATIASPQRAAEIQRINPKTGEVISTLKPFQDKYIGGMELAIGDVDGDGDREYIVAQSGGADARGRIQIWDKHFKLTKEFLALPEGAERTYLDVAVGNIDADDADEILVSTPFGKSSQVFIFNGQGQIDDDTVGIFEALPNEHVGASLAVGNVIGDEAAEIVIGSGPGLSPRVRILDAQAQVVSPDIIPFGQSDQSGVEVAVVNTSGGQYNEVVISFMNGGTTNVKVYRIDAEHIYPVLSAFTVWSREFNSGVKTAGVDIDGDGAQEIAVAPRADQRAQIKFYRGDGSAVDLNSIYPFEEEFRGGLTLAAAPGDKTLGSDMLVGPGQQIKRADPNRGAKYIEVNLSQQITYVWEDGYLRNVYLISSGLSATPSPAGEWQILKKIERHVYDGRPEYYFPNTPWNLRYKNGGPEGNYYFHTAYWHNNFGHPMSHGCINMRESDAKFLYFWADIGTPAWLHY